MLTNGGLMVSQHITSSQSDLKKYTEANREAWNEVTPWHQKAAKEKWDSAFMQPGFVCLDSIEVDILQQVGVGGKSIAHLCCNNGIELLSLKNLGAGGCVGFDICDEAIKEAQERAQRSHIACDFVRCDVYDIAAQYDNQFDMVYITIGAMGWLPDLKRFFARAAALLRENGRVFIHDMHPFAEMLPFDSSTQPATLSLVGPYFKTEPYVDYGGLDYLGHAEYISSKPQYGFVHTLSTILMSLIANGIAIEHFSEYETDISAGRQ
jgi:2-polyprenyl-3-methyl-5-hydroxy-6-metoxy-1,4-benzoquinol methylase